MSKKTLSGAGIGAGISAGLAALMLPGAALAQTAPAEATGVEDIIVTAQRRAQSLTDVPLSIAAVTGENLQAKGLESITDLRSKLPVSLA